MVDKEAPRSCLAFGDRADVIVCSLIALTALWYLWVWPRDLYRLDEGLLLYEAKRILEGEVPYRDFFEIIGPGSLYALALAFRVLGVTMTSARLAMAAVHMGIVVVMYLTCRTLGIRRELAILPALAHLAIGYPAQPIATPHWFSTFFVLLLQLIFLRRPWSRSARWALLPGLVLGALLLTQQHRGAIMAAAVAVLLLVDSVIQRRFHHASGMLRGLATYAGGVLLITAPVLLIVCAAAGWRSVWNALIEFPLVNYPRHHRNVTWGQYAWFLPHPTAFPRLLRDQLIPVPLAAARSAYGLLRRLDERRVYALSVLVVFATFSALSIYYNPDYAHLAVISPLSFIVMAEACEWAFRLVAAIVPVRLATAAAWLLALSLAGGLVLQLRRDLDHQRQSASMSLLTAFGRVDFSSQAEVVVINRLLALLRNGASNEMFCYQSCAGLYLTTGTRNPTRYQQLIPNYSRPEHIQEALDVLEAHRTPFIIVHVSPYMTVLRDRHRWSEDPVMRYISEKYRPVPLGLKGLRAFTLYRRIDR